MNSVRNNSPSVKGHEIQNYSVSMSVEEQMRRLLQPWSPPLQQTVLVGCFVMLTTIVSAFLVNVQRGDLDRAAVGIYFSAGIACVTWSQKRSLETSGSLVRSMQPLLQASRYIEEDAMRRGSTDSPELRRLQVTVKRLDYLKIVTRWQGPLVAMLLLTRFLLVGRHVIPFWPEVTDGMLKGVVVFFHTFCIAFSARSFLMLSGLHWMASLSTQCSLYLLKDRVAQCVTWRKLVDTVKLHQKLVLGIEHVQLYFAKDLSMIVRMMLLLGVIGAFRMSLGIQDVNNFVILVTVFSYIGMVCLAAEMQEEAGDAFWAGLTSCPWEGWGASERRHFNLLVTLTRRPSQVRFQYFGAMRLDTMSKIGNAVFKYTQVLRASLGDTAIVIGEYLQGMQEISVNVQMDGANVQDRHFPLSDLDQILYRASLGDPKDRLVAANRVRAPGAMLQVHLGLLVVQQDLGN